MDVRLIKTEMTKTLKSSVVNITTRKKIEMCEELDEELERGKKAVADLVDHLENMRASKLTIPFENDNGCYRITVIKTL